MADFKINTNGVRTNSIEVGRVGSRVKNVADRIEKIASHLSLSGSAADAIQRRLHNLSQDILREGECTETIKQKLDEIIDLYEKTENRLLEQRGESGRTNTSDSSTMQDLINLRNEMDNTGNNGAGTSQPSSPYAGDPINMSTGNYTDRVAEIRIAGRIPLELVRYYNACVQDDSGIGVGWTLSYWYRLEKKEKIIYAYSEDGMVEKYIPMENSNGVYASAFGSYGIITEKEEGYTWIEQTRIMQFDTNGKLTKYELSGKGSISFSYQNGKPIKAIRDDGAYLEYIYDDHNRVCCVKDYSGRKVDFVYEESKLTGVVSVDGTRESYTYNSSCMLETVTNAAGIVRLKNEYDRNGRVIKQFFADETQMTYEYDDENLSVSFIDRNGSKTTYVHDEKNRHVKTIRPNGTEYFKFNGKNRCTEVTDVMGKCTKRTFDNRGNLTSVIDEEGNKSYYTYDGENHLVAVKLPNGASTKYKYLNGDLIEINYADNSCVKYKYNEFHQVVEIVERDLSIRTFEYDAYGNMIAFEEPIKGRVCFEYDQLNRVTVRENAGKNKWQFQYDDKDRITTIIEPSGKKRSFSYQKLGKIASITDFDGYQERFEYGIHGKVTAYIDKEGRKTEYLYNSIRKVETMIMPNGGKIHFEYDENGRIIKKTDAIGNETKFEYDLKGNLVTEINAKGGRKSFAYDSRNNQIYFCDEVGNIEKKEYDSCGNVISHTLGNGEIEFFAYDLMNRMISSTDVMGNKTTYIYNAMGFLEKESDEDGGEQLYEYYPGGMLKSVCKKNGETVAYSYDNVGNLCKKTMNTGYQLHYEYDSLNRLVRVFSDDGRSKSCEYDAMGHCTKIVDPNGNITLYEYSPAGNMHSVIQADGSVSKYNYDEMNNLVGIALMDKETAKGFAWEDTGDLQDNVHITSFVRNQMGHVLAAYDALGNEESYEYDELGHMIFKKDRDGNETSYTYGADGMLTAVLFANGEKFEYEYNGLKQMKSIIGTEGAIQLKTDNKGRIIRVDSTEAGSIEYEYDRNNHRTRMIGTNGQTVRYQYDKYGRLSLLEDEENQVTYLYDVYGRLKTKSLSNNLRIEYEFDEQNRLSSLSYLNEDILLERADLKYDKNCNIISKHVEYHDTVERDETYLFTYDAISRLSSVSRNGQLEREYDYDVFGNIEKCVDTQKGITYYYYDADDRLLKTVNEGNGETISYDYDKRGNRIASYSNGRILQEYTYSLNDRLEKVRFADNSVKKYYYNGLGVRFKEETIRDNICEGTKFTVDYLNGNRIIQTEEKDGLYNFLWDDTLLSVENSKTRMFCLTDERGSITGLADADAQVKEQYRYDEYGRRIDDNNVIGMAQLPFGYAGFYTDNRTGMYYVQAREYDPRTGRFLSEDIIRGYIDRPKTWNHYSYAWANPINYVDQDGRFPTVIVGAIIGGIIGGGSEAISVWGDDSLSGWQKAGMVLTHTVVGAGEGAIAGTGVGLLGMTGVCMVGDGAANVVDQMIENKSTDLSKVDWLEAGVVSAVSGVLNFSIGAFAQGIASETSGWLTDLLTKKGNFLLDTLSTIAVAGGASLFSYPEEQCE